MAKSYFYDENISDWRELVKGEQGEQGPQGPIGPMGPQGVQGPMGTLELIGGDNPAITVDTSVGTRVFVGNTMIHGDTGWRDIGTTLTSPVTGGWIRMRRIGQSVELLANALRVDASGSATIGTLPQGFRPAGAIPFTALPYWGSDTSDVGRLNSTGAIQLRALSVDNQMNLQITFTTTNPWPTTLPGSPV